MVKRRIVSTGDKTTTGGTVIGRADSVNTDTGKAARLGDKVWCPACNQTGLIAQGYTGWMIDNKPVALDDYPVRCGCPEGTHRIIARNNSIFVDDNYSGIMYLPEQTLRANLSSNTLSHTYTHSTQQAPSSTFFQHSSTHKSIAATTRVFAKSCTVGEDCSDAAEQQEPSTNVGAMLIYSIVSAFSSPANAHHPSMLPYSGNNQEGNPYPVNGGTVGMAPVPVIIPTLPVPMMGFAPAPIISYPSPNINIPTLLDSPNAAFFVSSALLDSANSGKSFTSALMGVMKRNTMNRSYAI